MAADSDAHEPAAESTSPGLVPVRATDVASAPSGSVQATGSSPEPAKAELGKASTFPPRPRVHRAATAVRPLASRRPTWLSRRRGNTMAPPQPAMFDPFLWDSEEDEPSSDDAVDSRLANPPAVRTQRSSSPRRSDDVYRRFAVGNDAYQTKGKVATDGRLHITLREAANTGYLAKTLQATLSRRFEKKGVRETADVRPPLRQVGTTSTLENVASLTPYAPERIPKLNIVIMVIGSRGDIQPFLRLGKVLREEHGHRVRIATHPAFRDFVEKDTNLEFFSVGGDPAELMAFMVKNPGLVPKAKTIREGEIAKRREAMYEMFQGFWRACINTTDDEQDLANLKMMGNRAPFTADAIIANPPSFAHIHCAERLGVPLHLMFTFPTTPTQQFPHPLANVKQTNVDRNYTNFMSYPLVEMMTWQGLGDLVNRFRIESLGLEPISKLWAPGQLFRLRVPYSYLWSPSLIPKPRDWGAEIQITGFVYLDLASSFEPAPDLLKFLDAGEPPIYIGFGSIVVDDAERFTSLIFEAVRKAGVRALVSKGWGGLGDEGDAPEEVFMLGNVPHDWLFPRVSAVVHHGGAGSTAIGLKCGKPTLIVPFFGDQPFWGSMVAKAGAGPEPVPYKRLTSSILAESIRKLLTPECQEAARGLADQIAAEGDGAKNAVDSFHRALPLRGNHSMRCSILEDRVAVWWLKKTHVRLSALAAEILAKNQKIQWKNLRPVRHYDWNDFEGPGEPMTGASGAARRALISAVKGVGGTPSRWASTIRNERTKPKITEPSDDSPQRDYPSESDSPLARLDKKSGVTKRGSLPAANLGEGRLKQEVKQGIAFRKMKKPHPINIPDSTDDDRPNLATTLVSGAGEGFVRSGKAIVQAPLDISLALAQGFHNAPRLWGDETVRTPRRITGLKSGLRAAREEFVYSVSDGFTGLVWHPYRAVKDDGALGLAKGICKGVGGFVIKDLAALAGVPAYSLKGLQKEISRPRQLTDFIRRAHIVEGQKQLTALSGEEGHRLGEEVAAGWRVILAALEKREEIEKSGLVGRLSVRQAQKKWKKHGVFENVEQMHQALAAEREGRDFDQEFKHHRRAVKKAQEVQSPRKSAGFGGKEASPHPRRRHRKETGHPSIDAVLGKRSDTSECVQGEEGSGPS